jgi:hypothetical protein
MKSTYLILIFPIYLGFTSCSNNPNQQSDTFPSVIHRMHAYWQGKWPKYRAFSQTVDFYRNDSIIGDAVWHEWIAMPGMLRIDYHERNSGSGMLFRNDSVYYYHEYKHVAANYRPHVLLILADDLFFVEPDSTVAKLHRLGFDLSKSYETQSEYVVGINNLQETQYPHFKIDKQHLWLTYLKYAENDMILEVFMEDYFFVDGFPSEGKVTFIRNGELAMIEKYFDVKMPEFIPFDIFSPSLVVERKEK